MHVLVEDERGGFTLRRLWPWDRVMAWCLAARFDRQLARGVRPEASAGLAARAIHLTSMKFRRDLAASLRRILAAEPRVPLQPRVSIQTARIRQSAPELAELSGQLLQPGPVPARGVAMVCELLTDGAGPLYREACRDDLTVLVAQAVHGLSS